MIPMMAKIIMTLALSALSVVLYFVFKGRNRHMCMIAMLFCTAGDIFNIDGIFSFEGRLIVGGLLFMVGHVFYGLCFMRACKEEGYPYLNAGFNAGLLIVSSLAVAITITGMAMPEKPEIIMTPLVIIYSAFIGFNLCSTWAYAYCARGKQMILAAAVLLFYITDIMIFIDMLNINHEAIKYVWFAYPVAQLGAILFNTKKAENTLKR